MNVGYEVYRIKTQVTEEGGKIDKGFYIDRRCKETRRVRWERLQRAARLRQSILHRAFSGNLIEASA